MHSYEYNLSLRITHKKVSVEAMTNKISVAVGTVPKRLWKVGDQKKTSEGISLEGFYEQSYCYYDLSTFLQKSISISLPDAIEEVFNKLSPLKEDFQEFTSSEGVIEFYAGLYIDANAGMTYDYNLLKGLGELNIDLALDIYPPELKGE